MIVRPVPGERAAKKLADGKPHPNHGVSASWYEKGGLERDGLHVEHGATTEVPDLLVGDESKHMVARLPIYGFEQADLSGLAAAGLRFLKIRYPASNPKLSQGGYPRTGATIDFRYFAKSKDDHGGLGGLFRRRGNRRPAASGASPRLVQDDQTVRSSHRPPSVSEREEP
jgi:hypothetical protein